jgi:hypothetical protein
VDTAVVTGIAASGAALVVGVATVTQALVTQGRQLRHDRETRDLQVLREALDEALTSARHRYAIARDLCRRKQFGAPSERELADTQPLVPLADAKLVLRLGPTHSVAQSYRKVRKAVSALVDLLTAPLDGEPPDARAAECEKQAKQAREALDAFTDLAAALAQIDPNVLRGGSRGL